MTTAGAPKGPYKLVTVNTSPERAKRLIGRMVDELKDQYHIIHEANCDRIEQVEPTVRDVQPNVLFCASMWTSEEAERIQSLARDANPAIVTYAIPHGLQVEKGPEAIVSHLIENVPNLLETVHL